jgi:hypothetical protein
VVPDFPNAACAIGLYGQVSVQILIETDGRVISATAVSGHPLLKNVSVKAALLSTFQPVKIAQTPVRVLGYIRYNFIATQWNWLEIGFALNTIRSSFYSNLHSENRFPDGFDDEWSWLAMESENHFQATESVVASITGKLSNELKSLWLFSLGLRLGNIKESTNIETVRENVNGMKMLMLSKPSNISEVLSQQIETLISYFNSHGTNESNNFDPIQLNVFLKEIEQDFPIFGR